MFDPTSVFQVEAQEDFTAVLAESGKVYTWGLGARGRLGLNDTDDRLHPTQVRFGNVANEDSKGSSKKSKQPIEFEQEYERIKEARKRVKKMGTFDEMMDMHSFVNNAIRKNSNADTFTAQKIRRYSTENCSEDSEEEIVVSEIVMTSHSNSQTLSKAALNQNVWLSQVSKVVVTQVSCSNKHTLVTTNTGSVYGWGNNDYHQLGFDNKDTKKPYIARPKKIFGALSKVFVCKVETGHNHSIALGKDGSIYGWGSNLECQLGMNNIDCPTQTRPLQLSCCSVYSKGKKSGVRVARANGNFTCITTDSGKCYVSAPNSPTFCQIFINNGSGHVSNCFMGPDYAILLDSRRNVHFCSLTSKEHRNSDKTSVKVLENSSYMGFCCTEDKIWGLNSKRQAYLADIYCEGITCKYSYWLIFNLL